MPVLDASGEEMEEPYTTPHHLETQDAIGPIPTRIFYFGLAAYALGQVLTAYVDKRWHVDTLTHILLMAGPAFALAPFALGAWMTPPPEHGILMLLRHLVKPRFLGPDQLAYFHRMHVADRVLFTGRGKECLTIWRLPTVNLDVASVSGKRRHRGQWGAFLDALGHRVVFHIRATKLRRIDAMYRIYQQGSDEAKALAQWMRGYLGDRPLIARERLLLIPAPDPDTLASRCADIRSSLEKIGEWAPLEPETDRELEDLVNLFWPARPYLERLGPSMVQVHQGELIVDGEYVRSYSLAFPATLTTNWWNHLTDSDLAVDVALDVSPRDVGAAKRMLDKKWNLLITSKTTIERQIAQDQVYGLRLAIESSRVKPFEASLILTIRAATRVELKALDRRLRQRVRDRGDARLRLLAWEQMPGFERVAPLGRLALPQRRVQIETGTLARTTPLGSATLQLPDGVPLGEAGNAVLLFSTRAGQKTQHLALYGTSGSGKGYFEKIYKSRQFFQHDVGVWGVDSDEQHEYSGPFAQYLHAQVPQILCAADVDKEPITRNSTAVIWDLSACPDAEYGQAVARIIERLIAYVEQYAAPTDFFIDEAANVLKHPLAADRLEYLLQKGRHWGIGVNVITQLVSDWFGSPLGRRVHGLTDSWWCGQQNPAEIDLVASVLRLTAEEKTKIESAAVGRGLLVTLAGTRRVWVDLYKKVSDAEHDMAHTTSRTLKTQRRRVHHLEELMEIESSANRRIYEGRAA